MRIGRQYGIAVALAAGALAGAPGQAAAQRVGLFFDAAATVCSAAITPFGPTVHVYLFAYLPATPPIGGAVLRLVLPPNIEIAIGDPIRLDRHSIFESHGTLLDGIELRFSDCMTETSPVLLAEFGVDDRFRQGTRQDLVLHLIGATHDSSTATVIPQLAICDPLDAQQVLGYVAAPSVDATLNCTGPCGCTTVVQPAVWTAIKRLYQGR